MTAQFKIFFLAALVFLVFDSDAKIVVVNTTNNISVAVGETNFVQALQLLQDGDTIDFNIPGNGPYYLITPPISPDNGYPAITNNNVTIDGYSQPGAFPNTNTILASNTAQIQIVLDSRAGGFHVEDIDGYSLEEASVLMVKGATNVTIRGLDFLGPGEGSGSEDDPATYGVSFALGAACGHVNGCWFGIAPDRTNVFRLGDAVTGFQGADGVFPNGTVVGVEKDAPDTTTACGEFNVIVGEYIPIILEGDDFRISGNFINVYPDGVSDYLSDGSPDHDLQAFIEIGRSGDNLVIGTDGDGTNDAEERNIFGGVTLCDDFNLFEWYGASGKDMVIAGNYIGVGVDGVTRFANSMTVLGGLNSSTTLRFGSDFDGVSDQIERNVISMNYPFDFLFPSPAGSGPYDFSIVQYGACISFRGNELLGAELAPFTYAGVDGESLSDLADYCSDYISASYFPVLSTNSTQTLLRGSVPPGVAPFTNIVIDVYLADDEAWTNGEAFELSQLAYTDPATSETEYYGFPQGRTWLASFNPNSSENLDPTPGNFAFDISALHIPADTLVTVGASYGANSVPVHNAVMHTGPFSLPITLQPVPCLSIAASGTNILLEWPASAGAFSIQTTPQLNPPAWVDLNPQPAIQQIGTNDQVEISCPANAVFFRLIR